MRTRDVVLAVAIAAGFIVHAIGADWSALSESGHVILALLGLAIAFGAVGTMIYDHVVAHPDRRRAVDGGARARPLPLPLPRHPLRPALARRAPLRRHRLADRGLGEDHRLPSWLSNGSALKGFWTNAAAIPKTGKPAISYDWYRSSCSTCSTTSGTTGSRR